LSKLFFITLERNLEYSGLDITRTLRSFPVFTTPCLHSCNEASLSRNKRYTLFQLHLRTNYLESTWADEDFGIAPLVRKYSHCLPLHLLDPSICLEPKNVLWDYITAASFHQIKNLKLGMPLEVKRSIYSNLDMFIVLGEEGSRTAWARVGNRMLPS
jgi:hypothetical protein